MTLDPGLLFIAQNKGSDQIRSDQSRPTLCDPMNHSKPGLPVHHQLPEFTETKRTNNPARGQQSDLFGISTEYRYY